MSTVLYNEIFQLGETSQGDLPQQNALKKRIRRILQKLQKVPPTPISLTDLIIHVEYTYYQSSPNISEQLLLHDSGIRVASGLSSLSLRGEVSQNLISSLHNVVWENSSLI